MENSIKKYQAAYTSSDYLMHHGIKGQKWGIRRFQNPDGTLTEEGKARYYDVLSDDQKKAYDNLRTSDKIRFNKKFAEGKNFDQAFKELTREAAIRGAVVGTAVGAAYLYANPDTRPLMKSGAKIIANYGKALFNTIKSSNSIQKGSLWLKKKMSRRSMVKNGAFVMNKNNFSVRDIPFGGYLRNS